MATTPSSDRHLLTTPGGDPVTLHVSERGEGPAVLLLHGGAGPASVAGFADLLAAARPVRVVTPVHPGFVGTERPPSLGTVADLAVLYDLLLARLGLTDVTVVGNSLGGWVAAELALLHSPRIGRVVLVDAVGLVDAADPIVDFFALTMDEVVDLSYHPDHRAAARAAQLELPETARAAMLGNRAALLAYGGPTMADPTLRERLAGVAVPTLVVWGAADRVVPVSHGASYAAAVPGASLVVLDDAGHLPQLESPQRLAEEVGAFAANRPAPDLGARVLVEPGESGPPRGHATRSRSSAG